MTKTMVSILVLVSLFVATFVPFACAGEDPIVNMTTVVYSEYLIKKGKLLFPHPVAYNDLVLKWENGMSFEVESYRNLQHLDFDTAGDEIDITLDYKKRVGKSVFQFQLSYFDLKPLVSFGDGNIIQPAIGVSRAYDTIEHTIIPFLRLEYSIFDGKSRANGVFTRIGVADNWKIHSSLALSHSAALLFNEGGALGLKAGTDLLYFADLKWKVGRSHKSQIILPSIRYSIPLDPGDTRDTEFVFGAGYQWHFK